MATFADLLGGKLKDAIVSALEDRQDELTAIAEAGGAKAGGGLLGDVGSIADVLTAIVGSIPLLDTAIGAVDPLKPIEDAGGKLGTGFGLGYLLGYAAYQAIEPAFRPIEHFTNNLFQGQRLDPATAAELAAKGIIPESQVESDAGDLGFDAQRAQWLTAAAQVKPDLATALALHRRQLISDQQLSDAIQHAGYSQDWQGPLQGLGHQLLPAAELALAVLRGELTEEEALPVALGQGITAQDFDVMVANTGEPPGLMQLLEAYRREYIDRARLERGIRQSRVRDEWIDVVEALRYQRMSPADAIDATVEGHLSMDAGIAAAARGGLDPQDFQVLYDTAGQPISREEALRLMHRGLMSQAEVEQAIRESHVKDKYIANIIELGRTLIPFRTINTVIEHGVKDAAWGIAYLMADGYTQEDAQALVATARSAKTAVHKQVTESQALMLYEAQAIDKAEAVKLLSNLGYDSESAAAVLLTLDAKFDLQEQGKAANAVRTQFLARRLNRTEASAELDKIGLRSGQRDQLLADWQLELAGEVKRLTVAEVCDAVKYGFWSFDEGQAVLVELGYTAADAVIRLGVTLHALPDGVKAPPPQPIGG